MKTLKLYKAQRVVPSDPPVEGATIVIDAELPEDAPFDASRAACRFDEEAFALHYALKRSLPQGTMLRLAARLIEEVAGIVRVSSDVLDPGRVRGCGRDALGGETASCVPAPAFTALTGHFTPEQLAGMREALDADEADYPVVEKEAPL